jgi:hypothetical protein
VQISQHMPAIKQHCRMCLPQVQMLHTIPCQTQPQALQQQRLPELAARKHLQVGFAVGVLPVGLLCREQTLQCAALNSSGSCSSQFTSAAPAAAAAAAAPVTAAPSAAALRAFSGRDGSCRQFSQ